MKTARNHHHRRLKAFGARLAEGANRVGSFLDKGVGAAHHAAQSIDPALVDAIAGPEAGHALRHARTALQGYETARSVVTGGRRAA
jgi:hypothetical protein